MGLIAFARLAVSKRNAFDYPKSYDITFAMFVWLLIYIAW